MSFFITLNSNEKYPGNTISNFTNILNDPISFCRTDEYEVALVSLIYPVKYLVDLGTVSYFENDVERHEDEPNAIKSELDKVTIESKARNIESLDINDFSIIKKIDDCVKILNELIIKEDFTVGVDSLFEITEINSNIIETIANFEKKSYFLKIMKALEASMNILVKSNEKISRNILNSLVEKYLEFKKTSTIVPNPFLNIQISLPSFETVEGLKRDLQILNNYCYNHIKYYKNRKHIFIDYIYRNVFSMIIGIFNLKFKQFAINIITHKIEMMIKKLYQNKNKTSYSDWEDDVKRLSLLLERLSIYLNEKLFQEKKYHSKRSDFNLIQKKLSFKSVDRFSAYDLMEILQSHFDDAFHDVKQNNFSIHADRILNFDEKFIKNFPHVTSKDKKEDLNERINLDELSYQKMFIYSFKIKEFNCLIRTFNIFCDIIEEQLIDSKDLKILSILKPEGNKDDVIQYFSDFPNYVNVNRTFINTINITIKDENFNDLDFVEGNISIKLHFQKKKKDNEFFRNATKRCFNGNFSKKRSNKLHNCPKLTNRTCRRVRSCSSRIKLLSRY
jgi:hypothetical protein